MFTGIIEDLGEVKEVKKLGSNIDFTIASKLSGSLKIDQSVSHDGVCLTVVRKSKGRYTVTAIEETLNRSNLSEWKVGRLINLERATSNSSRLDGHIVQGHVDATAKVKKIKKKKGSWVFAFSFKKQKLPLLVDKGSVTVNGVSLTAVKPKKKSFSVAIIPYTFEHTNFCSLKVGDRVNLEFDIIGKYIAKMIEPYWNRR